MTSDKGYGIDGQMVDFGLVKSRSNKAGQSATLVYDQTNGFDEELSLFEMLKSYKRVNGAGAFLYIGDRSDMKFAQKNFKTKLRELPELRQVFMEEVSAILKTIAAQNKPFIEEEQEEFKDISSDILSGINVNII